MSTPFRPYVNFKLFVKEPSGVVSRNTLTGNYEESFIEKTIDCFATEKISGDYTAEVPGHNVVTRRFDVRLVNPKYFPSNFQTNESFKAELTDAATGKKYFGTFTLEFKLQSPFKVVTKILGNVCEGFFTYAGNLQGFDQEPPITPMPIDPAIESYLPAVPISALRIVTTNSQGELIYAQPSDIAIISSPLFITLNAGTPSTLVLVKREGVVENSGWNWNKGQAIFLGIDGTLTQTPISQGALIQLATVITPTKILFNPEDGIYLT